MSKSFLKLIFVFLFSFLILSFTAKNVLADGITIDIQSPTDYGSRIKVVISGCNANDQVTTRCEVRLYHGQDAMVGNPEFCAKDEVDCVKYFNLPRGKPNQAFITVLSDQNESDQERRLSEKPFTITGDVVIEVPSSVDYGKQIPVTIRNCATFTSRCPVILFDENDREIKKRFCDANICAFSGVDGFIAPEYGTQSVTLSVLDNNNQLLDEKTITLTGTPKIPTPTPLWYGKCDFAVKPAFGGGEWQTGFNDNCVRQNYEFCDGLASNQLGCCKQKADCQVLQKETAGTGGGCKPGDANCTSAGGVKCPNGQPGVFTALGCVPTEPTTFIKGFLQFAIGIGGGIAFLLMVYGAFQMITSAGNPDNVKKGADQLTNAVIGLLFILFSVMLLQIIGADILNIPGFK